MCHLKNGADSRGVKAKTYVIIGKVEFALLEAKPEALRLC